MNRPRSIAAPLVVCIVAACLPVAYAAGYFGLGTATRSDEIVIRWPGGHVDTLRDVPADQQLTVIEAAPRDTALSESPMKP